MIKILVAVALLLALTGCVSTSDVTIADLNLTSTDVASFEMMPVYTLHGFDYPCVLEGSEGSVQQIRCMYLRDGSEYLVELTQHTNMNDLQGWYDYNSLHLIPVEWKVSEDAYGDKSRFQAWNESSTYFYHLYIVKDLSVIHVTTKGTVDDKDTVLELCQFILAKTE